MFAGIEYLTDFHQWTFKKTTWFTY